MFDSGKNWQSTRSTIQKVARKVLERSDLPKSCLVCGYQNHVEVCHIKSVSEFDGSTLISDINSVKNLMWLCPNHHWEFDNGVLTMENILYLKS